MSIALTSLLAAALMTACGGGDKVTAPPPTPSSIVLSSAGGSVPAGGTRQFSAVVKDANGNTLSVTPTWSVVNGGGTINSSGLFTAGDSAATYANTVKVAVGSVSATSSVTVTSGTLATITVTPALVNLAAGTTQQYVATGADAHGNAVAIPDRVWSIAAGGGTIDTSGLFTASTTTGTYTNTVTATSGTVSGTASVTVGGGPVASIEITLDTASVGVGGTKQYTVVARDAHGNIVPVVPAPVWSVVAGGGTIDASTGLFTAGTVAGDFVNTIHVESGTFSANVTVKIIAGPLATLTVSPSSVSLASGATQQYTVVGKDANNNVVSVTPAWSVVAGGGTIDGSTGLFTAGTTAGDFTNTVQATVNAVTGTASVSVTSGALASITVTPLSPSVVAGAQQQFTAVGHDASNNVVPITPTWSVAAGGGTVDGNGLFTAGTTAGTFTNTVTATSGAITGTASVTVTPGALATIAITPAPASVVVNATQQFTVTGKDANNNVVAVPSPLWSVFAGGGTIDNNGLFTAGTTAGTFANTVVVTSGTLAATATVTVTAGAVATITITPADASVAKGSNLQYTAVTKDVYGNVSTVLATWTNGNFTAGTLSASGNFHASVVGFYLNQIKATVGTITGQTSVTVTP